MTTPHGRAGAGGLRSLLQVFLPVRGFAMCLVVAGHAVIGMIAAELTLRADPVSAVHLLGRWQIAAPGKTVILELCRAAVPLFLFLAAYHQARSPRSWKAIGTNSRKLLVPMAFWSLEAWAMSFRKPGEGWSVLQFLQLFVSGQAQLGYYFLILLIQYFVLSRWLVPAVEKRPIAMLAGAAGIQLLVHAWDYLYLFGSLGAAGLPGRVAVIGPFPEFLFPRFLLAFTFGIWASLNVDRFKSFTEKRLALLGVLAAAAAVLMLAETGLIFHASFSDMQQGIFEAASLAWSEWKLSTAFWGILFGLFVIAAARRWLPLQKGMEEIGKSSYAILLLHGIVQEFLMLLGYKYGHALPVPWYGATGVFLRFALGLLVPILLARGIRRWLPRPLQVLFLGS
jgi:fucose 4-O-acetylase-like acetyltransferase